MLLGKSPKWTSATEGDLKRLWEFLSSRRRDKHITWWIRLSGFVQTHQFQIGRAWKLRMRANQQFTGGRGKTRTHTRQRQRFYCPKSVGSHQLQYHTDSCNTLKIYNELSKSDKVPLVTPLASVFKRSGGVGSKGGSTNRRFHTAESAGNTK